MRKETFSFMIACLIIAIYAVISLADESLVLYLKLDEGNGDKVKDSSMYGNNGVIHGAVWVDGKYNSGLDFNGAADVEVPDAKILRLTEQATIAAWVKVKPSQEGWGRIVDKSFWQLTGYDLALNSDTKVIQWEFFVDNKTYSAMGKTKLNDDKWHLVVVTFDNAKKELKGYVDGVIDTVGPLAGQLAGDGTPIKPNDVPLHLGLYSAGDHHYIGTMDEVAVFNRAIEENEIQGIMEGNAGAGAVTGEGKLTVVWGAIKLTN
ncbi:MAG: large repetitive protein [Candidatus Poribacteria bacterium]|nr:large repetitive protein [Candidatus Poribacteria bacterium]